MLHDTELFVIVRVYLQKVGCVTDTLEIILTLCIYISRVHGKLLVGILYRQSALRTD